MKRFIAPICGVLIVLLIVVAARALIMTDSTGRWPSNWPKSLEPLRNHARTIEVANGTQEYIYEITFSDQTEFEKAWPTILSLKIPGAPLRLYKVGPLPPSGLGALESNTAPTVRIYGPSEGEARGPKGEKLKASAPWPKELYGPQGELPEFVRADFSKDKPGWVVVDAKDETGFHDRARIDLDLVIDGKIIDLNRIALPKNTPIEDHRFDR
jgi:hypothetical protein